MTTSTLTLTDFLLARIAEDEDVANFAIEHDVERRGHWRDEDGSPLLGITMAGRLSMVEHWVHNDPVRVLAECEAKREIVQLYVETLGRLTHHQEQGNDREAITTGKAEEHVMSLVLNSLILPYADHPDLHGPPVALQG